MSGISRTGPGQALRLRFEVQGVEAVDVALSRFGEAIHDFTGFWRDELAPAFFDAVQRNFDAEGRLSDGRKWAALSPAYADWKRRHFPGRKILELRGRLRRSLRWNTGRFSAGGRGNVGPGGIYRPHPTYVEVGTSVEYGIYHQLGAAARQHGQDASGRLRSRLTGRFVRKSLIARSVVSGRFLRGLPQRRFLFLQSAQTYGRMLHRWLIAQRDASGLGGNKFGSGGVSGSGRPFTRTV